MKMEYSFFSLSNVWQISNRHNPEYEHFEISLKVECILQSPIDEPRTLINDLWVFLFQAIDAECVKWASQNFYGKCE